MAAVIGREFDFRLLPTLLDGLSESRLLEVLDEALAAHVLEELTVGTERYQFSHVLIQQTLAEDVSPSRRIRLHARIAAALETLYHGAGVVDSCTTSSDNFHQRHFLFAFVKLKCTTRFQSVNRRFLR